MELRNDLPKIPPPIVSGYSLGAALALLYTLDRGRFYRPNHVLLLASPKIGDTAFCNAYNSKYAHRTFSVKNVNDPVVWVPNGKYTHIGGTLIDFNGRPFAHTLTYYYDTMESMLLEHDS